VRQITENITEKYYFLKSRGARALLNHLESAPDTRFSTNDVLEYHCQNTKSQLERTGKFFKWHHQEEI
jgi:hypothetical protein